ncbi:MAG TPA: dTMP kinase [Candidatus Acidoferrales bacterium]|nr:dTMP kinase [Candidatus Acidoferrales bacterium]
MPRGMLLVFEGIDGAGKRTQMALLAAALAARNIPCETISFPVYQTFFGRLIERYLRGEFGPLDQVDPHFSAMLFASDRLKQRERMFAALQDGKTLLADRYVASNLAHQGARVQLAERGEFLDWLRKLEYGANELPTEDLVLYLRIDPNDAQNRALLRRAGPAGRDAGDLHESDLKHLSAAAALYDELARAEHWITIDCVEPATGHPRSPEEIHALVMAAVDVRLARFRAMQALAVPAPESQEK